MSSSLMRNKFHPSSLFTDPKDIFEGSRSRNILKKLEEIYEQKCQAISIHRAGTLNEYSLTWKK